MQIIFLFFAMKIQIEIKIKLAYSNSILEAMFPNFEANFSIIFLQKKFEKYVTQFELFSKEYIDVPAHHHLALTFGNVTNNSCCQHTCYYSISSGNLGIFSANIRQKKKIKMITDIQLAIFSNVLGVFLFLLVVAYHYINANVGR